MAGVVVLHPWWGLNDDVVAYADQLATSLEEDVADAFALAAVDVLGAAIGDPTARLASTTARRAAPS